VPCNAKRGNQFGLDSGAAFVMLRRNDATGAAGNGQPVAWRAKANLPVPAG
jgi:uncharacterized protein involved in tellurium resistance